MSPDTITRTCERRLAQRTSLTASQVARFCPCFTEAALKKVSRETLAKEMESGSSQLFKDSLRTEFEQCKATMGR